MGFCFTPAWTQLPVCFYVCARSADLYRCINKKKNHFGFAASHLYSFVDRQVETSHEERTHSKTETFTRYILFLYPSPFAW